MQDKLITYALERSIYRLSISKYMDRFTLKGGIFLYALFDKQFARATRDIDLLANRIPNDVEKMYKVFKDVFSIDSDDSLRFDINSLNVYSITEFKEFHGVNVSINAYLNRTRIPVSIDIGFGDVVYPDRIEMDFPVILDMDEPRIFAYSVYSVISEKFEAFVSLGLINGRYKDFYDIVVFEDDFANDYTRNNRWKSFIKKKKAIESVSFNDAITIVKSVLIPIVDAIQLGLVFDKNWSFEEKKWK